MRSKTRDICYIGIFVAVIAICAQLSIPQPGGVPFSLQAWAVALSGIVLGARRGAIAAAVYVLLGFAGAPIFVGFAGGAGMIMRPTAGFLFSFPILAYLAGRGADTNKIYLAALGIMAGAVINFAVGMLFFSWVLSLGLVASFGYAVLPFIIPAVVKSFVLPLVGKSIKIALKKSGLQL